MATAAKPAAKPPVQTPQKPSQTVVEHAPNTGVALVPIEASGALALPADFAAELAQEAKDAAAQERPKVARLSLQGGLLSYDGQEMPNNEVDVVVLSNVYERTLYLEKYDADNISNPDCFSLHTEEQDEVPHDVVVDKKSEKCLDCKYNEWGSDLNGRKGKACKEKRRLALLPASALESAEEVKKAELALITLPVMSVRNFSSFVNTVASTVKLPTYGVVATLKLVPDRKAQYVVTFTPKSVIANVEVLRAIREKREEAVRLALIPFDPKLPEDDDEGEEPAATPAKKAKF